VIANVKYAFRDESRSKLWSRSSIRHRRTLGILSDANIKEVLLLPGLPPPLAGALITMKAPASVHHAVPSRSATFCLYHSAFSFDDDVKR